MARVLLTVPKQIHRGEAFEVKVLIAHLMESGHRRDPVGQILPREIINNLICTLDGELVLRMELFPAIAANPYLAFTALAEKSGILSITFTDDLGATQTETVAITVV